MKEDKKHYSKKAVNSYLMILAAILCEEDIDLEREVKRCFDAKNVPESSEPE